MRRPLTALLPAMFAFALLAASTMVATSPVSAAPIADAPITYCGDPDTDPSMDTGAGTMITCDTSVENFITAIDSVTGIASGTSVVSVTECTGPANGRLDPSDLTCVTDEQILVNLVTSVEQCNAVGYGGGNVLECAVDVTNTFVGITPAAVSDATVNQCNVPQFAGLDKTGCDPFPATTTGATITQCNDSSYGGGQEDFNCIATGSATASLDVTINQCNNSNYGGGSWLNCSANLTVSFVAGGSSATPTPTPSPSASPSTTPATGTTGPTTPPGDSSTATPAPSLPDTSVGGGLVQAPGMGNGPLVLVSLVFLAALSLMAGATWNNRVRE